jgi:hypothetical protein
LWYLGKHRDNFAFTLSVRFAIRKFEFDKEMGGHGFTGVLREINIREGSGLNKESFLVAILGFGAMFPVS